MTTVLRHPLLGAIRGKAITDKLTRFYSLPYASIPSRFARAEELKGAYGKDNSTIFDATKVGPSSIQLKEAALNDAQSNQLPTDDVEEQEQNEDCLRLTVTKPTNANSESKHPVLVFIHGGAFFLGSGDRRWLEPSTLCMQGLSTNNPIVFVSVNYRLGLLGFLHSSEQPDLLPANNALHDQIQAFRWVKRNIAEFGGDPDNVTAMGQSAGGESISLHNLSGIKEPLYLRSITLSGTLVTMPAKTPEQYQAQFDESAEKMNISVKQRSSKSIAQEMLDVDVDTIREANFVGGPCTSTEILPYKKPTMRLMRSGCSSQVHWLESQVLSSCTYDGSISYIMTHKNPNRKNHATQFIQLVRKLVCDWETLCNIYDIHEDDEDEEALRKICLFESDIGFVSATVSQAVSMSKNATKTYLQIFDLGNPFEGLLSQGKFASHTFDIVALLGAYEDRQSDQYRSAIRDWRTKILNFVVDGNPICADFKNKQEGLLIDAEGVRTTDLEQMPGAERRERLWQLAFAEKGEDGLDFLWEGVCRRWLDQGE